MELVLNLVAPLAGELMINAGREGVSLQDHASLVLRLASNILSGSPTDPMRASLCDHLTRHEIDPARLSTAFREFLTIAAAAHDTGKKHGAFEGMLRDPRQAGEAELIVVTGRAPQPPPPGPSGLGMFAHLKFSSDDYAREKQEELDREEARWAARKP